MRSPCVVQRVCTGVTLPCACADVRSPPIKIFYAEGLEQTGPVSAEELLLLMQVCRTKEMIRPA